MGAIAEESEPEFPSVNMKRQGPNFRKMDSEFENAVESVLADNKPVAQAPFRKDDLSDDDDDDIQPSAQGGNPLKDFTFVGQFNAPVEKKPDSIDSIGAIRDYLERELTKKRLLLAYPVLRDFGDNIFLEEYQDELVEKLAFVLTEMEVRKYQNFFALLVFHDEQVEVNGGGEDAML